MSTINVKTKGTCPRTHEGAIASHITSEQELKRSVLSCLLWEGTFYESGQEIAERIKDLVARCSNDFVQKLAIEAREDFKLRHVPLLMVRELMRQNHPDNAKTLERVIQRPDELGEFLAIYWKDGKCPLAGAVKKGLAGAFRKFDAYGLAKYNRNTDIKLKDVLFLCHAKPKDDEQAETWKKLIDGNLEAPDTWEVALSAGKGESKKETWERLLKERKLGALALLRNLRNMEEANVDIELVREKLDDMHTGRVLPFRFIAAARHAPRLEPEIEKSFIQCLADKSKLAGETIVLVDVSGSMEDYLSSKSDMKAMDAGAGMAMCAAELCERYRVWTFSEHHIEVAPRHGFALRDGVVNSQRHWSTFLGKAVKTINELPHDRLIVITDEQSHDRVPDPVSEKAYMINVASNKNGVGYGKWIHLDGFSESVFKWIIEYEKEFQTMADGEK